MKDKSERDLKPGDFIVYGKALGRCAGLNYGIVVKVVAKVPRPWEYNPITGKVRMIGLETWKEVEAQKPAYLSFSDRILIIEKHQIPERLAAILLKAYNELVNKGAK